MGQTRAANEKGNEFKLFSRLVVSLLIPFVLLVTLPTTAMAADPSEPELLHLVSVKAFRNLLETNDVLLVVEFNLAYETTPDDPARYWWLVRCLTPATVDIGRALPYSYGQNGYQYGIASMYWPAAAPVKPVWNAANEVRFEGNPTAWETLPSPATYTMASADYCTETTTEGNRAELEIWLITAFEDIEVNWGVPGELVTLTNAGTVLTAAGQHYLLGAIPGSNYMVPTIFAVRNIALDLTEDEYTHQRDTDTRDRYSGTMIGDLKDFLQNIFHVNPQFILGAVLLVLIGVLMGISFAMWGTTEPAYCLVPVLILYFAKLSFTPWAVFGLFTFAAAGYSGWMWLGRSSP